MAEARAAGRPHAGRAALILGFIGGAVLALLLAGGAWWLLFGPQVGQPRATGARMLGEPGLTLTAEERRGEALYTANCATCHGGPTGGSMMDYPPRHNANGHTWHHAECELIQVIREGGDGMTEAMSRMMAPPDAPQMPAFKDKLSAGDIASVLAYIKLMWTPQQRSVQAEITREQCMS